uniref:SJCHGC02985 protein n=1 Tax=Schistosoma japonicum TaxID=6182 RepID=Q5BT16_SCHJA|nr:SJCHGC02985 protein [Schistosoma japonicum]
MGRRKAMGCQTKTWHQSIKSLTIGPSHVDRCRLPGWGPDDNRNQWLEVLNNME